MRQMFESATLKLTLWYLGICMLISFTFSVVVYQIASSEIRDRFGIQGSQVLQTLVTPDAISARQRAVGEAEAGIFLGLLYANVAILGLSGVGSYWLARRTLEPIERAHESQSRFTSDASHELRTPLAIMKSELEVVLRDPKSTKAELRDVLSSNLEEVNRLSDLSTMLLKLSRQDFSGLEMTKTDFTAAVKMAIRKTGRSAKRIRLTVKGKSALPVKGNALALQELAAILLDNALKYSPDDSEVTVELGRRGSDVQLKITNRGKGITAADLPHVFKRFYRTATRRGSQPGFGLGLSLAKELTVLHGGEITISSAPGANTVATIRIRRFTKK